ncbi:MAG: helix-turn-helix domain-containing protein [Bermanella sp.]
MALRHVTLYGCTPTLSLGLGITQDIWALASLVQERVLGQGISVELFTLDGEPLASFSGMQMPAQGGVDSLPDTDLVILHALWGDPAPILERQLALLPQLRRWHENGVPILALTTASFLLAEAGLLDDRACTTHWHQHQAFAERYPQVDFRKERFITASGELYCVAGMNAALEVIVHLLDRMSCTQVAKAIEEMFLMDFRREYSSEFIAVGGQTYHQDESILQVQQWLEIHFASHITLQMLANKTNMSVRTFKRRFKEATGEAPMQFLQQLRLEQGKDMLRYSQKKVSEIAWALGYEDPGHFNRLFKRHFAATPARWRKNQP